MKSFSALLLGALGLLSPLAAAPLPTSSRIDAVTVYTDRAVVTRTATLDLAAAGPSEVVFDLLPAQLMEQSLQVSGSGTAQATVLEVAAKPAFVDFTPNDRVKALEDELRTLHQRDRTLADRVAILAQQRDYVLKIQNATTTIPEGTVGSAVPTDAWIKLLAFSSDQLAKLAADQQALDEERTDVATKRQAVEHQLNELRGSGGRSYQTVTVRLAVAAPGNLTLTLRYAVPGASWTPAYDARLLTAERAVQLGYFGIVRQNTGEDWTGIALTLSTARPALGGAAPRLTAWNLDVADVRLLEQARAATLGGVEGTEKRRQTKTYGVTTGMARELNIQAFTTNIADANYAPPPIREAEAATATVEAGATSASFKIATAVTVPSDGSSQKVPIATARLAASPEYLTVPKLQAVAFLTTKVANSTDYPLLAGAMNVFLDDTFVSTSQLRTVMPGEKFDLALGADESIAIKHKRVQKFTEDAGLTNANQRLTYDYLITVQNNKKTPERVIVVDQLPLTRNEKIVVKQLAPETKEFKPTDEGSLKWTLDLKPGEKRDIALKFTVDHPKDLIVTGLD